MTKVPAKSPERVPLEQAASDLSRLADLIETSEDVDAALLAVFGETKAIQSAAVDRNFLFHQYIKSQIALAKDMADNWKQRKDVMTNVMERHKERLKYALEANPSIPFKGQHGKIALQKSAPGMTTVFLTTRKSFDLVTEDEIFEKLSEETKQKYFPQILVRSINREKIKSDLKAGVDLPFAHLTSSNHVRFKV